MPEISVQFEQLRVQLRDLVDGLSPSGSANVRSHVLEIVPVHRALRSLGVSLFPDQSDDAARDRILKYLTNYPHTVLAGDELLVVAGIQEWARRLRELKTEFGWKIVSGLAMRQLMEEEEEDTQMLASPEMRTGDYILVDTEQDTEAALRWNQANSLRKSTESVIDKIRQFLLLNVGKQVSGDELRYVAKDRTEWARRVRELRTDHGWQVVTKSTGRPDLPVGIYLLATAEQAPEHDRNIRDADRRFVLKRDDYSCRRCGWSRALWNIDDARNLEVHHKIHHAAGGSNLPDNLVALCNVCHDEVHAGKELTLLSG